jgi:excisionase family DNA binding protein
MAVATITVEEAGRTLGVSRSTVWRLIQRGDVPSVRRGGRRLVPASAIRTRSRPRRTAGNAPFSLDHPMFRLVGAGRGGGRTFGAGDKHAILRSVTGGVLWDSSAILALLDADVRTMRARSLWPVHRVRTAAELHHQLHRSGNPRAPLAKARKSLAPQECRC